MTYLIGRIYKIVHNQSNLVYVGSTFDEIKYRWRSHKNNYNNYSKGNKHSNTSIYKYFKEYGI